ncbi:MAG: type II toxin-antitoxin system VapC family toxin [Bergeyella sp.]
MERYLLDTNIAIFLLLGELDKISADVKSFVFDYGNQLNTSSVVIMEIVQLHRIGKVKSKKYKTANELVQAVKKDLFIKILPFSEEHADTLSTLTIANGHNDPFDHAIISHAISEKLTLVSSDRQFEKYTSQNLNFVFNKR